MIKFNVKGDNSANPFYSSSLIINGLNEGAKKINLYDENEKTVVYSTTANDYGNRCDAILCVYESAFPTPIIQNARGRPLIGCSLHNTFFASDVYPSYLVGYCQLGVDSNKFKPTGSKRDRFRFLAFCESNVRSGLSSLIESYVRACKEMNYPDIELYIKDRGATELFKQYVKTIAEQNKVNIIHDTENTQSFEEVLNLYNSANFLVFPSYSTTWGMPFLEAFACGIPAITMNYAGPSEFCRDNFNSLIVNHYMDEIDQDWVNRLVNVYGFRHHMFPVEMHLNPPYWALPDLEHLKNILIKAVNNCPEYPYLSRNARITAEQFSWERAASTLSMALYKLFGK